MTQLKGDARANLDQFGFVVGVGEERATASHSRDLFKNRAPKPGKRVVGRISYADSIDLDIRLFDSVAQLFVCVTAIVVLAVRYQQECFFGMPPLLNFFNRNVGRIVERSGTLRLYEHQMPKDIV